MHISFDSTGNAARIASLQLEAGEAVHVLHPNQIVALQGAPSSREDSFMKLSGIYRKRRLLQSTVRGPVRFVLGLPEGYRLETIEIKEDEDLLFEFRHVLFYTEGISFQTQVQTVSHAMMTRDLVKMKFKGPGTLGLLASGPLYPVRLEPGVPLFVDIHCLVAYPQNVSLKPCVYGNTLASQHMSYQWEVQGTGTVILQPCKPDRRLNEHMQADSLLRRVLREVIPFGGVFIK
jgi:uncharacterized protein (AIM24 family)